MPDKSGKVLPPCIELALPYPDVLANRFKEAEFAADLFAVDSGNAEGDDVMPRGFFGIIFLTEGLKLVLTSALQRLSGQGGDPVIGQQTASGGGKTHTLLAIYHLARHLKKGGDPADRPGLAPVVSGLGSVSWRKPRRRDAGGAHRLGPRAVSRRKHRGRKTVRSRPSRSDRTGTRWRSDRGYEKASAKGDGIIKETLGGKTLATRLTELWPADRPHPPVAEVVEWFATYVYLPKLRDRAVLETAIRDALAKLDAKFAYAEGFDEGSGKYAALLWQRRRSARCHIRQS